MYNLCCLQARAHLLKTLYGIRKGSPPLERYVQCHPAFAPPVRYAALLSAASRCCTLVLNAWCFRKASLNNPVDIINALRPPHLCRISRAAELQC